MSKTKAPADVNVPATTSSSSPLAIESVIARVATQFPEEAKKLFPAAHAEACLMNRVAMILERGEGGAE